MASKTVEKGKNTEESSAAEGQEHIRTYVMGDISSDAPLHGLEVMFLSPEGPSEIDVDDPELTLKICDVRSEANTTKEMIEESDLHLAGLADIEPDRDDETVIYELPDVTDVVDVHDHDDDEGEHEGGEDDGDGAHSQVDKGLEDTLEKDETPLVVDKRSEKLGGHFDTLMNFMTHLAQVADNDYIILQKGGKPSESNAKFAYDMLEAGNEIMKAGQCLVDKSYKYLDAHERAVACWNLDVEKGLVKEEVDEDVTVFEESEGSEGKKKSNEGLRVRLPKVTHAVEKSVGKTVQKKGMKICHICQATFREQRQLEDHNRMHTGESLECDICHQTFQSEQRYKEHMRDHNQGPYSCPHCSSVLTKKSSFINHVTQVHNTEPMLCNNTKCSRTFKNKQNYEDHILHAHLPTKTCACDLCGKLCQTYAAVRTHKSVSCPERAAYRAEKRKGKKGKAGDSSTPEGTVSKLKRMWQKESD